MNTNSFLFGLSLIAFAAAAPASAQEFNGPHAGVQFGWESSDVRNPQTDLGTIALDDDHQTFTGGVFVGYDRQVAPNIVLGAEAGLDVSADDGIESANGLIGVDPDWSIDVTARAGYLIDRRTLAYVRGGYTNARVETNVANGAAILSESENRDGWLVGAGVERLILQNISARLEYRYSDLSEGDGSWDRHRVLAGIAYRF